MATTEELDVVIRTVGDTSGAQQVAQSLQHTQQAAGQLQQQLNAGQQGANAVMRALLAQHGATLETFEKARESVTRTIGVAPTLLPRDFGIQAAQIAAGARAATQATREMGESASTSSSGLLRFGAAALGIGFGFSAITTASHLVAGAVSSVVQGTLDQERAFRANTVALGQQAASFQQFAVTVAQQAGVTQQSLLEAGTAAAQFARQIGLGPQQIESLTAVATLLARIQGTNPSATMTQLTAALQGNAQAAQGLGIQLDAAYVAYSQLGGATADVFNQLDASTQAALRYQSALDQISRQVDSSVSPHQDLARATGEMGTAWESFVGTVGPGVVGTLAKILEGANGVIEAFQRLNALTTERGKQSGASDEGFRNEQAAINALGQSIQEKFGPAGQAISDTVGAAAGAVGGAVQEANDALRDTTGVDVLQAVGDTAQSTGQAVTEWSQRMGDGFDQLGQSAQQAADAITGSFRDADAALQQTAQTAEQARQSQVAALTAEVAGPTAQLAAARQNEIAAARELVDLRNASVQLGAQEAAVRLQMLPAQERMLELQNQTNQAQLQAQQRALPATRQLQDLQNAIEEQRLIATSGARSIQERTGAQFAGAGLLRQLPEAELAARRAETAGLPAQRAAQDVGLQAQLLALQQQAVLFAPEYQRQQLTLLSQIADAAKQAAQRTIDISVQAINLAVNQFGPMTPEDEQRIADLAGNSVAALIHQAVQAVNNRSAPPQLLGAGG
jgi:hypothetical protein